ncbi:MAG: EAL domain-containing protein [Pseudomonadota bacterium]
MHLRYVLCGFALLLAVSTTTSFVGYRYLSLAGEYRERNFVHLSEIHKVLRLLDVAPTNLRPSEIDRVRAHLRITQRQAEWCLDVLSDIEQRVFVLIGAGRALDVCRQDIELHGGAFRILDDIEASSVEDGQRRSSFALGLRLRDHAQAILEDSLSFHPYVSRIEDKVNAVVRTGTVVAAFGLSVVFLLIARELSKALRTQARQTRELSELAMIAERANDCIVVTDARGHITWANPAFETLTGYDAAEVVGWRPGEFLQGPATDPSTRLAIRAALAAKRSIRTDILNFTREGVAYWINLSIAPIHTEAGGVSGFVAVSSDITKEREQRQALETANQQIAHQALHDPLTDLPNRRFIDDVLEADVKKDRNPRTIVRIDLDHFKNVNDTLGHAAGDHVLCRVAEILRRHVRASDTPARVGGDEFVILLAAGTTQEQAVAVTERVRKEIRKDIVFEGQTCRIGASFGVASAEDGVIGNDQLLKSADAALYVAKAQGRNTTTVYTPDIHSAALAKRRIATEIELAIEREEFRAYFQPQFSAEGELLVGVEALARWDHPERGLLAPAEFLPIADELKLVPEIDRQVFRYGLECVARLNAEGLFIPKIAFNAGLAQLMNPDLERVVRSKDIGATKVALEVLESVLIEDQSNGFQQRVDELRAQSFGIELDDFGSGHASVISLQRLNPDIMKLDRELVAPVDQSQTARSLVRSMIEMGRALGIGVIAEGIETATHASILRELGCDAFQGYFFAKPMPFGDLRTFARTGFDEKLQAVVSLSIYRDTHGT